MAQDVSLIDLPVGSTAKLKIRLVSDNGTTMAVDFLQEDGTVHGHATITKATGAMTGQLTVALEDTLVEPVAFALTIGEVVRSLADGQRVQVAWISEDGTRFSNSTGQKPEFSTDGWVPADDLD